MNEKSAIFNSLHQGGVKKAQEQEKSVTVLQVISNVTSPCTNTSKLSLICAQYLSSGPCNCSKKSELKMNVSNHENPDTGKDIAESF